MQKTPTWGHWKVNKSRWIGRRVKPGEETHTGMSFPFFSSFILALSSERAPNRAVIRTPLIVWTRGNSEGKPMKGKSQKMRKKKSSWKLGHVGGFYFCFSFMICHWWAPQLSPGSKQCLQLKLMGSLFFWQRKWEKNLCSLKNVKIIPIFLHSLCPEGKLSCGNCTVIVMELKFWENPYIWSEDRAEVPFGARGELMRELEKAVLYVLISASTRLTPELHILRPKAAQQSLWELN